MFLSVILRLTMLDARIPSRFGMNRPGSNLNRTDVTGKSAGAAALDEIKQHE